MSARSPAHRAALAALVSFSVPSAAQDGVTPGRTPATDELARAVDQLVDDDRRGHATAVLVAAGDACVPLLAALLERSGNADEAPAAQACAALEVLGALGLRAGSAQGAIESTYRFASDLGVRNRATWALAEVARGSRASIDHAVTTLRTDRTQDLDRSTFSYALIRLHFGAEPDAAALLEVLDSGDTVTLAVARAARDLEHPPAALLQRLEVALAQALQRDDPPWRHDPSFDLAAGELATTLHHHGVPLARIARGLLQSREPALQKLALRSIPDASQWPLGERLDLVKAIWSGDRETRELAVATLQGLGVDGLLALRPLRAFAAWETQQSRPRRAQYYARCADRLVASAATRGDVAAEVARRADAALRAADTDPSATPVVRDDAANELLAAIVYGCRGAGDDAAGRLAALVRATGPTPFRVDGALRTAFLSLLDADSREAWCAAAHALAILGPSCVPGQPDELASLLLDARPRGAGERYGGLWVRAEAMILAGPATSTAELHGALRSERWNLALRAATELLTRDALLPGDVPALQHLLADPLPLLETRTSDAIPAARAQHAWMVAPVPQLRAIAALALTALGEQPWRDAPAAAALSEQCELAADDLATALPGARSEHRLAAMAQRIEQTLWERHGWPQQP